MVSWRLPLSVHPNGRKPALEQIREGSTGSQVDKLEPSKSTPEEKTTTIRFDLTRSTVHPHISLDQFSDEEFSRMWVTAEEFMASKKEYVAVVRQMMKTIGEFPETADCCPRGLEFKTKDGARRRKQTKQRACFAVLEEQDIQRDEGTLDDQFICDVYAEFSSRSSLEALHRGLKDEKTMLALLDDNERLFLVNHESAKKNALKLQPAMRMRRTTEKLTVAENVEPRILEAV